METNENRKGFSRFFDSEPLDDEVLEVIVNAGLFTRDASDRQLLHLTVIRSREELEKFRAARKSISLPEGVPPEAADQFADPTRNAPVVILVSAKAGDEACPEGCPSVNRMIAAAAGRGVIGTNDQTAVSELFARFPELKAEYIPEGYELRAVVLFGHPGPIVRDLGERLGTVEYK